MFPLISRKLQFLSFVIITFTRKPVYIYISTVSPPLSAVCLCPVCQYLAWSLKRSKAVNKSKKVVGVIGKGHMNGVIYALVSDQGNLRFSDLAGKKSSAGDSNAWLDNLLKSLVRDTVIGFLLWELYEQIKDRF